MSETEPKPKSESELLSLVRQHEAKHHVTEDCHHCCHHCCYCGHHNHTHWYPAFPAPYWGSGMINHINYTATQPAVYTVNVT